MAEDDPCQEGYTQVGMKTQNGREVPNCVPDEDVPDAEGYQNAEEDGECPPGQIKAGDACVAVETIDAPPSILSDSMHLTLKSLETEPIERIEEGENTVRYTNVKLLSPGIWTDSGSGQATYYPPEGIANLDPYYDEKKHDGPPLNIAHDLDTEEWEAHEASVAGHIDPDKLNSDDDGNLYSDLVFDTSNGAGQYADENLKSTLENQGRVGFGGPSVEIPAEGLEQSEDPDRGIARVDGGRLTGAGMVMDPASKSVAFSKEAARRPIAMSEDSKDAKALYLQDDTMSPKTLNINDLRGDLEQYNIDTEDMTDEDVLEFAKGLHGDLMEDLENMDDVEMESDYEDDEEEDEEDTEMGDYEDDEEDDEDTEMQEGDDVEALQETVQNLMTRLEDIEDAVAQAMSADEVDSELSDIKNELADAETVKELEQTMDKRLSKVESEGKEPKTMADAQNTEETDEWDFGHDEESVYDPATGTISR